MTSDAPKEPPRAENGRSIQPAAFPKGKWGMPQREPEMWGENLTLKWRSVGAEVQGGTGRRQ